MVYEIVEQMNGEVPDAIVCCVGGGGLIGGIFKGIMRSKYQTDLGLQTVDKPGWKDGTSQRLSKLIVPSGCHSCGNTWFRIFLRISRFWKTRCHSQTRHNSKITRRKKDLKTNFRS